MDHHIDRHFDDALAALKQQIQLMGAKVETMLSDCITALAKRDGALAERVMEDDRAIDALEVAIDEQCIQLLARYQPAASDLRFITRGLKIVTDLERVGDLAGNIADRIVDIVRVGECPVDFTKMAAAVQKMLKGSIESFVNMDVAKAELVLKTDDEVDEMTGKCVIDLIAKSENDPVNIKLFFPASSIARYLERIADHSTNIAELSIFMVKGRDVRHKIQAPKS